MAVRPVFSIFSAATFNLVKNESRKFYLKSFTGFPNSISKMLK